MHVESMNVTWRARSIWEGCDLGIRLLQENLWPVFRCHLAVALPMLLVCTLTHGIATWLPTLLVWWLKPLVDRPLLYSLSRALFGTPTRPGDIGREARSVLLGQLWKTLTLRRLSMSRSFTQPIHQLEGVSGQALRERLAQVATRNRGAARLLTQAFASVELSLYLGLIALQVWLTPHGVGSRWLDWQAFTSPTQGLVLSLYYMLAVLFLEPFYVAAGFGMYLNRRVQLEAWDIEQEFRRAFAT